LREPIELRAVNILQVYNGSNDYILWLKRQFQSNKLVITATQAKYVVDNHNVQPTVVNKLVELHPFYSNYFKKMYALREEPSHMLVYKVLSRKKDDIHIWGAFEANAQYHMSIFIHKRGMVKRKAVADLDFSEYSRPPKPHQVEAVKTLLSRTTFILADDMGLGKTTSAILAAVKGDFKKILVVCPASLKLNWKKEISNYDAPSNISVVDGNDFRVNKWTVINYDILKNFHHLPVRGVKTNDLPISPIDFSKFDLVIADEAHYLKNSSSNRTKIFKDFADRIPTRWLLTGTPITNKPIDFFSLLDICESPLAQNWQAYVKRYCAGKQFKRKDSDQKFWVTGGASNLDELRRFSSDLILRRTKKELNLPPKTKKPVYLPLSAGQRYHQYMADYNAWLDEMEASGEPVPPTAHLTKLSAVRQLLAEDKVPHTIEMIQDYIEEGHKVIVFSCFTSTLHQIYEHFKKESVLVDGGVSSAKRQMAVDKFQENDKIKLFCGNIVAAGVGLTLTKADIVIFNDLDWVPANHAQAEDRAHRIGQENEVHIIYQLVDETIDNQIYETLQRKMKVINQVLGDEMIIDTTTIAQELIKTLRG
jgi:SNF2 family DNA or RNA helicase